MRPRTSASGFGAEDDLVAVLEERPLAAVVELERLAAVPASARSGCPRCRARRRRSSRRPSGRRCGRWRRSRSRGRAAAASSSRGRARCRERSRCRSARPRAAGRAPVAPDAEMRQRLGLLRRAAATQRSSSSANGITQAEIEVAKLLPRNGPSGTYSQAWMSRALQSLTSTTPKTCSRNADVGTGSPSVLGTPTTKPSSSSMSSRCDGPKLGASASGGLRLALRPPHRRAADDDRACAAVVADRQVAPVRQQRLGVGPEQLPEVRRVLERGVEVDVVGDRERQLRLDVCRAGASARPRVPARSHAPRRRGPAAAARPASRGRGRRPRRRCGSRDAARRRAGMCRSPGSQDPEILQVLDRLEEGAAADRDQLLAADARELVRARLAVAPVERRRRRARRAPSARPRRRTRRRRSR